MLELMNSLPFPINFTYFSFVVIESSFLEMKTSFSLGLLPQLKNQKPFNRQSYTSYVYKLSRFAKCQRLSPTFLNYTFPESLL